MHKRYIEETSFEKINRLEKGTYEHCQFQDADFSSLDFSGYEFIACSFINCNLSLLRLKQTVLQDIIFRDCKMLGLRLDECNFFGLSLRFERCQLNHASFYKLNLRKTRFKDSQIREADFTETDLSGAVLDHCDLKQASFHRTNLEGADLRTAINYSIHPAENRIKKARFSASGIAGLLDQYQIRIE